MNKQDRMALAEALERQPRLGAELDTPEGARYVQVSETLARKLAAALRGYDAIYVRVIVNGRTCSVDVGKPMSYRAIAELAGVKTERPTITWRPVGYPARSVEPGNEIWPTEGAVFNAADTSNA